MPAPHTERKAVASCPNKGSLLMCTPTTPADGPPPSRQLRSRFGMRLQVRATVPATGPQDMPGDRARSKPISMLADLLLPCWLLFHQAVLLMVALLRPSIVSVVYLLLFLAAHLGAVAPSTVTPTARSLLQLSLAVAAAIAGIPAAATHPELLGGWVADLLMLLESGFLLLFAVHCRRSVPSLVHAETADAATRMAPRRNAQANGAVALGLVSAAALLQPCLAGLPLLLPGMLSLYRWARSRKWAGHLGTAATVAQLYVATWVVAEYCESVVAHAGDDATPQHRPLRSSSWVHHPPAASFAAPPSTPLSTNLTPPWAQPSYKPALGGSDGALLWLFGQRTDEAATWQALLLYLSFGWIFYTQLTEYRLPSSLREVKDAFARLGSEGCVAGPAYRPSVVTWTRHTLDARPAVAAAGSRLLPAEATADVQAVDVVVTDTRLLPAEATADVTAVDVAVAPLGPGGGSSCVLSAGATSSCSARAATGAELATSESNRACVLPPSLETAAPATVDAPVVSSVRLMNARAPS